MKNCCGCRLEPIPFGTAIARFDVEYDTFRAAEAFRHSMGEWNL